MVRQTSGEACTILPSRRKMFLRGHLKTSGIWRESGNRGRSCFATLYSALRPASSFPSRGIQVGSPPESGRRFLDSSPLVLILFYFLFLVGVANRNVWERWLLRALYTDHVHTSWADISERPRTKLWFLACVGPLTLTLLRSIQKWTACNGEPEVWLPERSLRRRGENFERHITTCQPAEE